jgi:hypothetical protein
MNMTDVEPGTLKPALTELVSERIYPMSSRTYNSQKHHRRSIRLKGYDYSQTGAYFVTICSYNRGSIFGEIVDGEVILSRWRSIVYMSTF